jgi:hypothetical protein
VRRVRGKEIGREYELCPQTVCLEIVEYS